MILSSADLTGADLTGTHFTHTDLSSATLTGATLTGAVSQGIKGTPAALPTGWQLADGYLIGPGANLTGATSRRAVPHRRPPHRG